MKLNMRLRTDVSDIEDKISMHRTVIESILPSDPEPTDPQPTVDAKERADGILADIKVLEGEKKAATKRPHPEFGGMGPFNRAKLQTFRPSVCRHFKDSMFCSGERQRIVKFMIENDFDGMNLDESQLANQTLESRQEQQLESFKNPLGDETTAEVAIDDNQMSDLDRLKSRILARELRIQGYGRDQLEKRKSELEELGLDDCRAQCREWTEVKDFFPMHDQIELDHLVASWGRLSVISDVITKFDWKTGGFANILELTEQPIEEIRDYFGEQIALYFAFLRIYTESLMWPAMIGVATMVGHFLNGVEGNPLSLVYSIAVSFWSVYFLAMWGRREAELQFLWGTADFESNERPRPQFQMKKDLIKLELNEFTGLNEFVTKNPVLTYVKKAGSVATVGTFIVAVILAAVLAMYIKLLDDTVLGNKAKIAGSLFNVVCIVIFGKVYEDIAVTLNDWEHHRTQTEYEDSQIFKSFVFQIVNNYFVLFFIAFLKQGVINLGGVLPERNSTCMEVEVSCDAVEHGVTCVDGIMSIPSCMTELEIQLIIVFIVKQFAMQGVEVGVPYVKAIAREKLRVKAAKEAVAKLKRWEELGLDLSELPDLSATAAGDQYVQEPYASVFADYNELAIQFGYRQLG